MKHAQPDTMEEEGDFVCRLKKPLEYNGRTYDQLTFDFASLTGRDALAIEREINMRNVQVIVPAYSIEFVIRFAARACMEQIGADAFEHMSASDFIRIRTKTRNFLVQAEL